LWEFSGGIVLSGPFKGLKYPREAAGSAWAPKLLGTYESELSPIIERIISGGYGFVVDIGAAEGYYYALGLAKRMPSAEILCFEQAEDARKILARFAAENEVASRGEIHGMATRDTLAKALNRGRATVVICDVEGAEVELLVRSSRSAGAQASGHTR
jgi:hypothetical protein